MYPSTYYVRPICLNQFSTDYDLQLVTIIIKTYLFVVWNIIVLLQKDNYICTYVTVQKSELYKFCPNNAKTLFYYTRISFSWHKTLRNNRDLFPFPKLL